MTTKTKKARHAIERELGLRRPLVLTAARDAQETWQRLGGVGNLENAVTAALSEERVMRGRPGGVVVWIGDNTVADLAHAESRLTGRRAWRVVAVRPERRRR